VNEPIGQGDAMADKSTKNEKPYFAYGASLRIFGNIPSVAVITGRLGIDPTEAHRKGERGR